MSKERTPTILGPNEGQWLAWLGQPVRYLATGRETENQYAFSWGAVPVGGGPAPHRHDFEECFYVLKGEVTFTAGNQSVTLEEGGFIHIGSGTAHYLENTGTETAELLVLVGPTGFDQFQFEGGTRIADKQSLPESTPPTDLEFLKQIGTKYSIDLSPPETAFDVQPEFTVRQPGEGKRIAAVGDLYRFLAESENTNGKFAIWEAIVAPGGGPPPHVHHREEEGFFILQGEIAFSIGEQQLTATAGSFANMPVGIEHAFKNKTDEPAKMLIIVAPGGLESMFERTGVAYEGSENNVPPPSQEEIQRLLSIAPDYGLEIRIPEGHS